ncbi:hypothetical protein [Pseudomonas sp. NMI542_15]|uniref:hypothetical protein n=1 Tax=Pseudomonas sp. NMI542_15 TaxID=2903148 RepID=UPI001E5D9665|nr:hypothetical protein [Pseudomonas sp. NMI542_15]MCE0777588.1 hypothetical protein [Pseudomonas sp. NMI542_15]
MRFQRSNPAGQGFNVVRPGDPNALPIEPHHLRRAFGEIPDQFAAFVGLANGRLDGGNLDLPPEAFLLDLCLLGPAQLLRLLNRENLTAQEVWPFVATALAQQGTERPYWFMVSLVDDIGQLVAQLRRAARASNQAAFTEKVNVTVEALQAKRREQRLNLGSEISTFAIERYRLAEEARDKIPAAIARSVDTEREASEAMVVALTRVQDGGNPGQAFGSVLECEVAAARPYWARLLADASSDTDDRVMLIDIQRGEDLEGAKTAARKALRLTDIITYGPLIELE